MSADHLRPGTEEETLSPDVDEHSELSFSSTVSVAAKTTWGGWVLVEEAAVVCIYPVIVLLGQLVHIASPEPSYFSNKKNIFNTLFVKQAWLWTTLAFVACQINAYLFSLSSKSRPRLSRSIPTVIARYLVCTMWWIVFTQWMFGLPLMDRVFVLTGGACTGPDIFSNSADRIPADVSSAYCRSIGGTWIGGYDPSGHTFLMTHASMFLWFELLPYLGPGQWSTYTIFAKSTFGLIALWGWMMLMTAIYFHSLAEKAAGLVAGYCAVTLVYIVARRISIGRKVFGVEAI